MKTKQAEKVNKNGKAVRSKIKPAELHLAEDPTPIPAMMLQLALLENLTPFLVEAIREGLEKGRLTAVGGVVQLLCQEDTL